MDGQPQLPLPEFGKVNSNERVSNVPVHIESDEEEVSNDGEDILDQVQP